MIKVLLAIPPDYDHNYPPLGTPALSAFLKKSGVPCAQVDLNHGYRDFLAGRVTGDRPLTADERRFFLGPLLRAFFGRVPPGRYYAEYLPAGDPGLMPYHNNSNSSFHFCERLLSSPHLERYLDDCAENTFLQYFDACGICGRIEREGVGLFGISVISPSQAVAALTLGQLVKRRCPDVHVTMGGQWVTLYREQLCAHRGLFRCFDSIVAFEGESALRELAARLSAGTSVAGIANVATRDAAFPAVRHEEDMDALPCPDFDGLPLADYDASRGGKLSLTYETSRGCYWSKCAYCVDLPLPKPSYRRKDPALVARDMRELRDRYGAGYLLFGDPGLSPRQMADISRQVASAGVSMEWWTMARLDPGFTRELFDRAYAAGLRQVNFGFETANDRVAASLDKGNLRARSSRVIRDCAAAGIRVDLQTMIGLPGETFADGLDTVDFLVSHRDVVSHATFNTYYLTPCNHIHRDPARYGIEYAGDPALPFRFFIPFVDPAGMTAEEAQALQDMYHALLRKDEEGEAGKGRSGCAGGRVELRLNGESCALEFRRDPATEAYEFCRPAI